MTKLAKILPAAALLLAATAFVPSAQCQSASAQPSASATAQYSPMRAAHDVEVGKFYFKNGNLDAAISRLKEAITYKSNYAEPRLLLGEAYEKKNDPKQAIRYYDEYLKILPDTPEAKKVRERIAKLKKESGRKALLRSHHPNRFRNFIARS